MNFRNHPFSLNQVSSQSNKNPPASQVTNSSNFATSISTDNNQYSGKSRTNIIIGTIVGGLVIIIILIVIFIVFRKCKPIPIVPVDDENSIEADIAFIPTLPIIIFGDYNEKIKNFELKVVYMKQKL